jgi:hypothetical protein
MRRPDKGKDKSLERERRNGYDSLIPQYEELLYDVVEDVFENKYTDDMEKRYKEKLSKLDTELKRVRSL